jgi:uncharacterized membrane protein
MTDDFAEANFPDHVDEAVRSVTQLHSDHHGKATTPQRAVNRITALMARPWFITVVGLSVAAWIVANLIAGRLGLQAIDPPPFHGWKSQRLYFRSSSLCLCSSPKRTRMN